VDKKYLRFTHDGLKWFPEDKIYCDNLISSGNRDNETERTRLLMQLKQEQEKVLKLEQQFNQLIHEFELLKTNINVACVDKSVKPDISEKKNVKSCVSLKLDKPSISTNNQLHNFLKMTEPKYLEEYRNLDEVLEQQAYYIEKEQQKQLLKCGFCQKTRHTVDYCWKLYPSKKPVYKLLLDMNKEFKPSYYFNITKENKEKSNEYNNKRFLGVYDNKEDISKESSRVARAEGVGKDGGVKQWKNL